MDFTTRLTPPRTFGAKRTGYWIDSWHSPEFWGCGNGFSRGAQKHEYLPSRSRRVDHNSAEFDPQLKNARGVSLLHLVSGAIALQDTTPHTETREHRRRSTGTTQLRAYPTPSMQHRHPSQNAHTDQLWVHRVRFRALGEIHTPRTIRNAIGGYADE